MSIHDHVGPLMRIVEEAGDDESLDTIVYVSGQPTRVFGYNVVGKGLEEVLDDFQATLDLAKQNVETLTPDFIDMWIARLRAVRTREIECSETWVEGIMERIAAT